MNWRLFALGLIIAVVSSAAGGYMGHFITLKTNQSNIEQFKPTIDKAINKATNQITNEIKVDKIKKSDSLKIIMQPANAQKLEVVKSCGQDSICIAIKHLTRRQKKRLNLK